jgi:AcrR family transcriptional regulator
MSPRSPDPHRKEHIRRKAAQLFARNGYHGTGVQQLSEAVGLGRGALYHHIGSKEALVEEIVMPRIWEMIAIGETLQAEDLPPHEKVRRLSRAQMRAIAEHLPEWTVFQRDAATLTGPVRKRIFAARDRFERVWAAIIDEGVEQGVFRSLDPIAIKGILGMHNYGYLWIRRRGRLTPDEIADVFCDLLLEGLLSDAS